MSHEIRTPMNAILGMIQLLAQTHLTAQQYDYTEKTERAAKSLLGILNSILDFSKIEAGKLSLDIHPFPIDKLIRELAVIVSTNAGNKHVETLFNIDPKLPVFVKGDSLRLLQILINLTGNALKFTERGEVILSLQLLHMNDAEVEIMFSVTDSGIGIENKKLSEIFEGFSQAESSTAKRFGGTGLGLAISQRLVNLMGGTLKVESQIDVGSRFFFSITLERVQNEMALSQKTLSSIPGITRDKKLRALIVDDNKMARDVLASMIVSLGWHCDKAESGVLALQAIERSEIDAQHYDVVFMDWSMPEMDGWQASRLIREKYAETLAPIIIMVSAHGRQMLAERLRTEPMGLDGFLVKPVTASMLFDAVVDAKAGAATLNISSLRRPSANRLAGLHLLVVEDNAMNQQVARELLAGEGAQVTVASNGREGVEKTLATSPRFDAVLMDLQMPDMDGFTATLEIRRHDNMQDLPIIAMTANAMESDKEACFAMGMNGHIAKPIDLNDLVSTIRQHCKLEDVDNIASVPTIISNALGAEMSGDISKENIDQYNKALQRIGNNQVLFINMANTFVQNIMAMTSQLRNQLSRFEKQEAGFLLHTIKGIAGTVGATELRYFTAQAETQIADMKPEQLTSWFVKFAALVERSCEELLKFSSGLILVDQPEIKPVIGVESDELQLLKELMCLLEEKNMRAMTIFTALKASATNTLAERLLPVELALNNLDFSLAYKEACALLETYQ